MELHGNQLERHSLMGNQNLTGNLLLWEKQVHGAYLLIIIIWLKNFPVCHRHAWKKEVQCINCALYVCMTHIYKIHTTSEWPPCTPHASTKLAAKTLQPTIGKENPRCKVQVCRVSIKFSHLYDSILLVSYLERGCELLEVPKRCDGHPCFRLTAAIQVLANSFGYCFR